MGTDPGEPTVQQRSGRFHVGAPSSRHQSSLRCLDTPPPIALTETPTLAHSPTDRPASAWSVFLIFLRLGLTSFGGPIAHLGYFRDEFVTRRRWLSERSYGDLVALCQFLPGPASSQVGIALGLSRAGISGAIAAFLGFTLPSAMAMCVFALMYDDLGNALGAGFFQGFKLVSVAVVAQALWSMGKNFSRGTIRTII